MSIETMTKLTTYTVTTNDVTEINFNNIPQTYTDLVIKVSARDTTTSGISNAVLGILFNGDASTSNLYSARFLRAIGSTIDSINNSNQQYLWTAYSPNTSYTSNTFSNVEFYIPNYSGSNTKSFSTDGVTENNAASGNLTLTGAIWNNTAPITSLKIYDYGGSYIFAQQTTVTLYGIRNARRTAGNSVKATGGNISFDGTYVYHTFNTTSTFSPTSALTADLLVVAGGGGASAGSAGPGGGGAGGLLYNSNQSLTVQNYTVTIGAGGAGGVGGDNTFNIGSSGGNSQFGSLTAAVGGGRGADETNTSNINGGSGGGAAGTGGSGGTGTVGQGNNGGSGVFSTSYAAGGGGGAGAVGGNGTGGSTGQGGAGGVGLQYFGTFYAGGGGAGGLAANNSGTNTIRGLGGNGGGGAGGQGTANYTLNRGTSGTPNTGGGGGGGGYFFESGVANRRGTGGSGGSGVVIIRYKA